MHRTFSVSLLTLSLCFGCASDPPHNPGGGDPAGGDPAVALTPRALFVVDVSNSMAITDPNSRRVASIDEVIDHFAPAGSLPADMAIAIIGFSGAATVRTESAPGTAVFSTNPTDLHTAAASLATTGPNTSYDQALAAAQALVLADAAGLTAAVKARISYRIAFVTDGLPFPDSCLGETNAPSAAVAAVTALAAAAATAGVEAQLWTFLVSGAGLFASGTDVDTCTASDPYEADHNDSVGEELEALLTAMATAGNGRTTRFDNGDAINFWPAAAIPLLP
jgi:hypothetical protein